MREQRQQLLQGSFPFAPLKGQDDGAGERGGGAGDQDDGVGDQDGGCVESDVEGIRGGTFGGFTRVGWGSEPTLKLVWVSLCRVGWVGAAAG